MSEDEVIQLCNLLAENPLAGDLIQGTGGARKLRFAKPGRGKSAGYRVITYYAADDIPVFLMDVYAKGEKVSLSGADKAALKQELASFAETYREGERKRVIELRRTEVAS